MIGQWKLYMVLITLKTILAYETPFFDKLQIKPATESRNNQIKSPRIGVECYITIQMIKEVPGQCKKLARGIYGCATDDNMIDPFHPDCNPQ